MFHTFQTSSAALKSPDALGEGGKPARTQGSRRISTSNACVECRRRKIRCDGAQPCGQCQWYQHPEACAYSKPAQRIVPSRKLVDKLSGQVEQYRAILQRLFPQKDLETLVDKPREELLDLALSTPAPAATSPSSSIPATNTDRTPKSEGEQSLEALEQAPDENPEWDEARKHQDKIQGISDDINGLSMAVDRHSSYVGISSITAALKVIVKVAPIAKPYIVHSVNETALPSRCNTPPPELEDASPTAVPKREDALKLVTSYFEKIHVFFPMIDERKFWTTFLYGDRRDSPWLALLNIIFALGSLASSTADNESHYVYFTRARQHLTLESFGSGNLEVLQALAIMSGYYMHYLNRPNEAHSLMGGALRMACTLGLHREFVEPSAALAGLYGGTQSPPSDAIPAEMRRRIWWSLFCLDSWASTTTGRPSLGSMGSSITVQPPGKILEQAPTFEQPNSPQSLEALKILPLVHFSEFCKTATKIQDALIETPLIKFDEQTQFDSDLVRWHEDLPAILSDVNEPCPEFLKVIRLVMKWRYQNLRLVLHRPTLLACGLRRTPFASLTADEKVAVGKCRIIAGKTIEDMVNECPSDLIAGWNAVWFTYQACMVPLVSLFTDASVPEEVEKWKVQIETALLFFERIKRYSVAAKRSQDAVARLYDAYKAAQSHIIALPEQSPSSQVADYQQFPDLAVNGVPAAMANEMHDPNLIHINQQMAMDQWQEQSPGMGSLSNIWDDMMWDTNFPDMTENDYMNELDFQQHGQQFMLQPPVWRFEQ